MYTPRNLLQVRVVMKAVGSMTCDVDAWAVNHGAVVVVPGGHRVPLLELAHVANREGGPFQPNDI